MIVVAVAVRFGSMVLRHHHHLSIQTVILVKHCLVVMEEIWIG